MAPHIGELTGTYVPTEIESMPPDDNTLPGDIATYSLTINSPSNSPESPDEILTATVTIYQPTRRHSADDAELEAAMANHSPRLEKHLIPIGNHYEVAYMTRYDWSRYQEAYNNILVQQETRASQLMVANTSGFVSHPLFSGRRNFNYIFSTRDTDVPKGALGHLRHVDLKIPGGDGVGFVPARGFVATNTDAEVFLQSRGYIRQGEHREGSKVYPLYLAPLDASLSQPDSGS